MFAPFMTNTWIAATLVAVVAGVVGFFIVVRGSAFMAHAIPHGAFAGAAGAVLIGVNPLVGLGVFAAVGAVSISVFARHRAQRDVITALTLTMMLGLGSFFLSRSGVYASEVFALLFGQILGVSSSDVVTMTVFAVVCLVAVVVIYRPLLLSSVLPDMAAAQGVGVQTMSLLFALIVACSTTMTVPVVGALLMFVLLIGPPAAAQCVTRTPAHAIALSIATSLVTVWVSIGLAYATDLPVGFFVATMSALFYLVGRLVGRYLRGRRREESVSQAVVK